MRRRKDPIPPGAEIYWGDRGKYWAFVLVLIIFYLAFFAMAIQIRNKPFGAEDCLVAGILVAGLLIIFLVMWHLTGGYTLIDGDQVETRGGFGKVATFRLSEITGYRFGPTRRNPIIRQNQTLWLYRGEERIEADFQQRPGRDRPGRFRAVLQRDLVVDNYNLDSSSFEGETSKTSHMSNNTSKETAQSAVSIRLICVRLIFMISASLSWDSPRDLR